MRVMHALRWWPSLLKDLVLKPRYDPVRFWERRHAAGHTFWTVGRRAFDETGNEEWYGRLADDLRAAFSRDQLDLKTLSVYEIGAGIGYWTRLVCDLGCRKYEGTDLAGSAVAWLRSQFSSYSFEVRDAATDSIPGLWDVILMMHVDEHVHGERFTGMLRHVKAAMTPTSRFFTTYAPVAKPSGLTYVEYHTREDFARVFPDAWIRQVPQPNRGDPMLAISAAYGTGR
ncbi:MAG TPA: class I SAM-dependent methyltransferase [Myxococcota bacterium]|nr:class I SAM-dependent methyltransferase [Myxococcota bacterium]